LLLWGLPASRAEKAIGFLVDENYIDNSRFCRAYCLDKFRYNHWGRIKIEQMLRMLEMDSDDIKNGLDAIPEEEYQEVLSHVLSQKNRQLRDSDPYVRKAKLVRHALSRGFETHAIMDMVEEFL
jgi:regulatory protein